MEEGGRTHLWDSRNLSEREISIITKLGQVSKEKKIGNGMPFPNVCIYTVELRSKGPRRNLFLWENVSWTGVKL